MEIVGRFAGLTGNYSEVGFLFIAKYVKNARITIITNSLIIELKTGSVEYVIILSRLSILSVKGRIFPIELINLGITSNGKNRLLRKNIGSTITNELNRALFSEFDIAPSINPMNMKLMLEVISIKTIIELIGTETPNNFTTISITIISSADTKVKKIIFANKNKGIEVGLNKVLAKVPVFRSYTRFEEDTRTIVNNNNTRIKPGARNSK